MAAETPCGGRIRLSAVEEGQSSGLLLRPPSDMFRHCRDLVLRQVLRGRPHTGGSQREEETGEASYSKNPL